MMDTRKIRPCTVRTQAPVRPVATSPASSIQMMQQPKKVPTIVARPPKMRGAANQDGGDRRQQVALPLVAEKVLVLERQHHGGDRRQHAHQRVELDFLGDDVDSHHSRHVVRVADEQHMFAEAVAVEDEPEKDDDERVHSA